VLPAQPRPFGELRAFAPSPQRATRTQPIEQGTAIVRGAALYAADVRRPGLRFGRVLRAPASPELASHAVSLDEAAARAVPGFVALVQDPLLTQGRSRGVGIVAATPGALERIAAALDPRWSVGDSFDADDVTDAIDVDRRLGRGALAHRLRGDAADASRHWDVSRSIRRTARCACCR
jgi:isoquinoline 1-oxidoreductase beta subunit